MVFAELNPDALEEASGATVGATVPPFSRRPLRFSTLGATCDPRLTDLRQTLFRHQKQM